jgi:D-amino peptidase
MNKYLISVDIEGITGVVNKSFANPTGKHYELARKYMHHDVNAVVQGIISLDASALVIVRDAHDSATNLDLEKLHPKAHLMQGWGNSMNMIAPVDTSFKGVFLVGYHAGGQNNDAVLGHTWSSLIHYVKINDTIVNETGIVATYAGHFDVPIVFISGDDHAVREAKALIPNITGVIVKESYARDCALSMPLNEASALLEKDAVQAMQNLFQNNFAPYKPLLPIRIEIRFYNVGFGVSFFQKLYYVLRFDNTYQFDLENFTVTYKGENALEILNRFNQIMFVVYGIKATTV